MADDSAAKPVAAVTTARASASGSRTVASATNASQQVIDGFIVDTGPPQPVDPRGRYYIEFRSRWLNVYGHTYIVYGRLDDAGKPVDQHFVALYPQGGFAGLAAGSLPVAVPGTTLPVWGDSQLSSIATYRQPITAVQYAKILEFVYETRSKPISWNLYAQNCNHFAGELARHIGLRAPDVGFQLTPNYIKELENLNRSG